VRTIGIISDTHGLLRQEAVRALQGCDLIIHAGDVGESHVLESLGRIAPVRAVRGNTDWGELAKGLPETEVVDLSAPDGAPSEDGPGPEAYVLHIIEEIALDPAAAGFRVVIHGHTHEPKARRADGVLYLNPGSAGPRRFHLPVSIGRLRVDGELVEAEIVYLEVD
jgi:hypothetical protein